MTATKTRVKKSAKGTPAKPVKRAPRSPTKTPSLTLRHQRHKSDTGSTPVQITLLSREISELLRHLKKHPKDSDSRLGLIKKVGRRRKLLNYLHRSDEKIYLKLISDLGLRG